MISRTVSQWISLPSTIRAWIPCAPSAPSDQACAPAARSPHPPASCPPHHPAPAPAAPAPRPVRVTDANERTAREVLASFSEVLERERAAGLPVDHIRAEAEQWLHTHAETWSCTYIDDWASVPKREVRWYGMSEIQAVHAFCQAHDFDWYACCFDRLMDRCADRNLEGMLCALELTRTYSQPLDRYFYRVKASLHAAANKGPEAERLKRKARLERGLELLAWCTGIGVGSVESEL